jgi:hypothetical protein
MCRMNWKQLASSAVIASTFGLLQVMPAHAGDVSVGINIGFPAPPPPVVVAPPPVVVGPPPVVVSPPPRPVVVAEPPQVIVVPGSQVYYAPYAEFDLFVYGGRYYRFHDGHWFIAGSHHGPWRYVVGQRVPAPVLAVPVAYYKIPPGHARHDHDWDNRDDNRGHRGKRGRHD